MQKEHKKGLLAWLVIAALAIGVSGWVIVKNHSDEAVYSSEANQLDRLAQCLTEKGAKMYGAFWCSHCQKQKASFGTAWQHINYVECSNPDGTQQEICQKAGIQSYPTWDFGNGLRESGEISFQDLAKKAGCAY